MAWEELQHTKRAVRRAGDLIGSGSGSSDEILQAREIVRNFRSSHAYPLLAITMLVRQKVAAVNAQAVVARRLKRLPTILDKLVRHPSMNVTSMHDLGGCRVVLPDVEQVDDLVHRLKSTTRARNAIVKEYDYLREAPGPQPTGYRGVHLVYEYRASKAAYVGHKVEVQIRTELQHMWATAVETLDLFGGTRLKYGEGDSDHSRFFLIASSLMALQEQLPQPEGAPGTARQLRDELHDLDNRLGISRRLTNYAAFVRHSDSALGRSTSLILELRLVEQALYVSYFETNAEAADKLAEIELRNDDNIDAVLVTMSKLSQLRTAYPNYFADTTNFVRFVQIDSSEPRTSTIRWD